MTRGFAMLCAKAWRESRQRFAISALLVGGLCAGLVLFHQLFQERMAAAGSPMTSFAAYAYGRIYGSVVRSLFVILAILLGLGGLSREATERTIGFTLALPVRRIDHVLARAAVGLGQVAALAALPIGLVPGCAALVGERFAIAQAAQFALLWLAVGAAAFAASFVVSVVVRGDHAALAVAMVALRIVPLVLARLPLVGRWQLSPDRLMSGRGMSYFDAAAQQLIAIPWSVIAGALAVALTLLAIAAQVTARDRFLQ